MTKSPKTDKALPPPSSLPEGWHTVRFGDVAKKISDIVDRKNCTLDHFVAGEHMQTDDFRIKEWGTINEGYLGPAFNHKFSKGQILYGSRRTYLRKVSLPHFDGVCANTTFVIEPTGDDLIPELLPFVMQSAGFNEQSIRMSKGSTNPYINWKDIACYEFAIPEKEQQRRIATTLWAAEDCIVKGERFVAAAERAKQVLMQELFSKGIGHRDFQEVKGFGKLPKKWEIKTVKELFKTKLGKMLSPISKTGKNSKPYLRNVNIQWGRIDVSDLLEMDFSKEECERFCLIPGDILVCEGGEIGRTAIWHGELQECYYQKAIHRLRPLNNQMIPEFFAYHMMYAFLIGKIYSEIGSITTIAHLPEEKLEILRIPVPPLPEQRQIAGILSRCDETIASASATVAAAKALKMRLINEMLSPGN